MWNPPVWISLLQEPFFSPCLWEVHAFVIKIHIPSALYHEEDMPILRVAYQSIKIGNESHGLPIIFTADNAIPA